MVFRKVLLIFIIVTGSILSPVFFTDYFSCDTGQGVLYAIGYPGPYKDSIPKAALLKKLADAFRFSKNARANEQKRMLALINQTLQKDSLILTRKDIHTLSVQLAHNQNMRFDSLVALINSYKKAIPPPGAIQPVSPKDTSQARNALAAANEDMDALVNELIPILKAKLNEDNSETGDNSVAGKLSAIRSLDLSARNAATARFQVKELPDGKQVKCKVVVSYKAEVFGFHPYWMNDKYLNYNMMALNTLAYYCMDVDGRTGGCKNLHGWDTAAVVDAARKAGVKVVLTVTENDAADMDMLFKSKVNQQKLIDTIYGLVSRRKANGVNLSFGAMGKRYRASFVSFISALSRRFREQDSTYMISVNLPAFDKELAYNLQELDNWVDAFIILNYDFKKNRNKTAAPIAPLTGDMDNTLEASITRYQNKGIPSRKLILCVPYFGAHWVISQSSVADRFDTYMPYSDIMKKYADEVPVLDKDNMAVSINVKKDDELKEQVWFDNNKTLGAKYDYILQNKLKGVGIWALGYDDGYTELWDELAGKFISVDTVADTIPLAAAKSRTSWFKRIDQKLDYYMDVFEHPQNYCSCEYRLDDYLYVVNVILAGIIILIGGVFIYGLKNQGDDWRFRRPVAITLIGFTMVFCTSICINLFLASSIPWFGVLDTGRTPAMLVREGARKDTAVCLSMKGDAEFCLMDGKKILTAQVDSTSVTDSVKYKTGSGTYIFSRQLLNERKAKVRRTIPLAVILSLVLVGFVVGALVMWLLAPTFLRRREVP